MSKNIQIFQDEQWKNVKDMGLCEINDYIHEEMKDILEELDFLKYESQIKRLNKILDILEIAKDKGQSMEYRLQDYREAIEGLGFKRVKEKKGGEV